MITFTKSSLFIPMPSSAPSRTRRWLSTDCLNGSLCPAANGRFAHGTVSGAQA